MEESITDLKKQVCEAGRDAVKELIKIAKEEIVMNDESVVITEEGVEAKADKVLDLSADKLTRAAQAKKIAIMDAFEILERVEAEELNIERSLKGEEPTSGLLAESRAKKR